MKVSILTHTMLPETIVAASAKLCYSKEADPDRLVQELSTEPQERSRFVHLLVKAGHESPVEHASFTFGIEGVSRSLLAQITRHRIASYSVKSQRYVEESGFDYVIPPKIAIHPEAERKFRDFMRDCQEMYNELRQSFGIEPEDARFVLPNACCTSLVATFNVRSLYNFFNLRCCYRAQWEIRNLATEMLRLVRRVAPALFKDAGPRCLTGPCPEGEICGRGDEARKKFRNL